MKKFIISILFVLLAGTFTAKAFAQTSVDVQVDWLWLMFRSGFHHLIIWQRHSVFRGLWRH